MLFSYMRYDVVEMWERLRPLDRETRDAFICLFHALAIEHELPKTDAGLARKAQCDPRTWKRIKVDVARLFDYAPDWMHPMIRRELIYQTEMRSRQRGNARKPRKK